jgi:hypothetical protein
MLRFVVFQPQIVKKSARGCADPESCEIVNQDHEVSAIDPTIHIFLEKVRQRLQPGSIDL